MRSFTLLFDTWSESRVFQAAHWILLVGGGALCFPRRTSRVGMAMLLLFATEVVAMAVVHWVVAGGKGPSKSGKEGVI